MNGAVNGNTQNQNQNQNQQAVVILDDEEEEEEEDDEDVLGGGAGDDGAGGMPLPPQGEFFETALNGGNNNASGGVATGRDRNHDRDSMSEYCVLNVEGLKSFRRFLWEQWRVQMQMMQHQQTSIVAQKRSAQEAHAEEEDGGLVGVFSLEGDAAAGRGETFGCSGSGADGMDYEFLVGDSSAFPAFRSRGRFTKFKTSALDQTCADRKNGTISKSVASRSMNPSLTASSASSQPSSHSTNTFAEFAVPHATARQMSRVASNIHSRIQPTTANPTSFNHARGSTLRSAHTSANYMMDGNSIPPPLPPSSTQKIIPSFQRASSANAAMMSTHSQTGSAFGAAPSTTTAPTTANSDSTHEPTIMMMMMHRTSFDHHQEQYPYASNTVMGSLFPTAPLIPFGPNGQTATAGNPGVLGFQNHLNGIGSPSGVSSSSSLLSSSAPSGNSAFRRLIR
jgi:hypothetical protein